MMFATGGNGHHPDGKRLFYPDKSNLWVPPMNSVINRSFSSTPASNMLKPTYHSRGDEGEARVINRDNNYPNNQRKSVEMPQEAILSMVIAAPPSGPRCHLVRRVSECPSEDSFIVFDDDFSLDDCAESDLSDYDSESDSDDPDDCEPPTPSEPREHAHTAKKVRFETPDKLVVVHRMIMWSFAYRASRRGPWEEYVRDRARFQRRIDSCRDAITPILDPAHRSKVYAERIAPFLALQEPAQTETDHVSSTTSTKSKRHSGSLIITDEKKRNKPKRHKRRRNGKKKRKNRHKIRR